jgi:putative endonuclease
MSSSARRMTNGRRDRPCRSPYLEPPAPVPGYAFVYILGCEGDSLYIGIAHDVAKRLIQHGGHRGAKLTGDHPGGRLVYLEGPFSDITAVRRERQLKRWSRPKKLALIRNQIPRLKELSRSREIAVKPFDALSFCGRRDCIGCF